MGRPKKFSREEVLEKAMPLFWTRGFADTGLQDLEKVTGVNKSGLYSEFKDKEDIFLASLQHYFGRNVMRPHLSVEPLGWKNIENFFTALAQRITDDQKGCFAVNSMRDLPLLPPRAQELILENRAQLKKLFIKNIAAEKTKFPPEALAEILSTFFSGMCIEQNMKSTKASLLRKIEDQMKLLRG